MADLLADLERMVANVEAADIHCSSAKLEESAERWQRLFGYSKARAEHEIEVWRSKLDRLQVSDDLWALVREENEGQGYDREAYEYVMWLENSGNSMKSVSARATANPTNNANTLYVLKLEEPLHSAEKVQEVAHLTSPPKVVLGAGESGDEATFCTIDSLARQKVLNWIAESHPVFRPTIVRLSQSPKALDDNSMAPALGFDTTLPHHRPSNKDCQPEPTQDQYPVWYFFYGNLAKADELQRRLGLSEGPTFTPASIRGGRIRSWRGQYRALVDRGVDTLHQEHGSAYLVASKEHEDILRFYETEKYEVVRCNIEMKDRTEKGLVFRFAGADEELV